MAYVENKHFEDLSKWFNDTVQKKYLESRFVPPAVQQAAQQGQEGQPGAAPQAGGAAAAGQAGSAPAGTAAAAGGIAGTSKKLEAPKGEGWVVELKLHHFFNKDRQLEGAAHVQRTLLKKLEYGSVVLPAPAAKLLPGVRAVIQRQPVQLESVEIRQAAGADAGTTVLLQGRTLQKGEPVSTEVGAAESVGVIFTYQELGISYPTIVWDTRIVDSEVPNPNYTPPAGDTGTGSGGFGPMGGGPSGPAGPGLGAGGQGAGLGAGGEGGFGVPGGGGAGAGGTKSEDEDNVPKTIKVRKYECIVQFAWQERLLTDRLEAQHNAWKEAKSKTPVGPPPGQPVAQRD